ncbi:MAG: hypothetical protein ACC662_00180 [Planctomycetota bacterium]
MRWSLPLLVLGVLLLPACGGGGTSGSNLTPPPDTVVKITSNDVGPITTTYRAVYDWQASVSVSGQALDTTVTGTLTIENEGTKTNYPVDPTKDGWSMKTTIVLRLTALQRALIATAIENQTGTRPDIPSELPAVATVYVHEAEDGSRWSLGGVVDNPLSSEDPAPTYGGWWETPMLEVESTMFGGQTFGNDATDLLADDLVTVLATRSNSFSIASSTQELDVLGKTYETYVTTVTETLAVEPSSPTALVAGGTGPTIATYTRWERPDMGILAFQADDRTFTVDAGGTPTTITLENMNGTIRSFTP